MTFMPMQQDQGGLGSLASILGMGGMGGEADPSMQKQMMQQALLRTGLGMMSAGAQGARPGQAFGQAGLGALDEMQRIGQIAYMNKMRKQREEKEDQRWNQNFELQKSNMEETRAWRKQQADEDARRWEFQKANTEADNARADRSLDLQASGSGQSSYYTPVQTSSGFYVFDNRTGKYTPMTGLGSPAQPEQQPAGLGMPSPAGGMPLSHGGGGVPLMPINADVSLAGAKSGATATGKAQAEARMQLPQDIANAEQSLGLIDQALAHPGLPKATGLGSWNPINKIPGTDAANFSALQDQLKGKAFLQAYQTLKGGGQITEVEGAKAENAIARLQTSQSTEEYKKSLGELRDVIRSGIDRSKAKAGGVPNAAPQPQRRLRFNPQTGQLE